MLLSSMCCNPTAAANYPSYNSLHFGILIKLSIYDDIGHVYA